MPTVAIVIATCGDWDWQDLARRRALPSAVTAGADQLITLHRQEKDVCAARNLAARAADADWLIFLDADDELAPGYLQALQERMVDEKLLLAPYVRYVRYDKGRRMATQPHIPNQGNWPNLNELVTSTAISRALFEQVGGWDNTYWPWSDWELWLRCHQAGASHEHVPEAVYVAHDAGGGENHKLRNPVQLHAAVKAKYAQLWET